MALVLHRRELAAGEAVEGPGRGHHQEGGYDNGPADVQRAVEQPGIPVADGIESAVDQRGQPSLLAVRVHEPRAHHR